MKNYIVHDENGNILRTGICPDDALNLNARENETVIEGIANDKRHVIVDGKICNKPVDVEALKVDVQERFRVIRNAKLTASDWTQHSDVDLTQDQVNAWKAYRKELRDLPSKYEDLMDFEDVVWPTQPA